MDSARPGLPGWYRAGVACFFVPLTTITLSGPPLEKMAVGIQSPSKLYATPGRPSATSDHHHDVDTYSGVHASRQFCAEHINPFSPDNSRCITRSGEMGCRSSNHRLHIAKRSPTDADYPCERIFWLCRCLPGADAAGLVGQTTVYRRAAAGGGAH